MKTQRIILSIDLQTTERLQALDLFVEEDCSSRNAVIRKLIDKEWARKQEEARIKRQGKGSA